MENRERIVILGAGESGTGSAILAKQKGFDVFVSDSGRIKPVYREMLDENGIIYESGGHTERLIVNANEIIKSPGISENTPIVRVIRKKGIRIISEIEFAGRYTTAKKICITGSNGKTTTTSLIHHMMRKAGLNVGMAGNVGKSFAYQVAKENYDYYVLELSSFQLDGMYEFKADIAILLNITPDHLDRYNYDLQNYVDSKFRITQNLTEDEYFVFCSDDEITIKELERIVSKAVQLPFAYRKKKDEVAWIDYEDKMHIEFDDVDFSMSVEELALKGKHNSYNSMAAGIAGNVLKIRNDVIREALMDFQGVEHRLESVLTIHGINFMNDSKATNVNSTWYALESVRGNIVWIAGGIDKGNNYSELYNLVENKVKALVCLGKDNSRLLEAFRSRIETIVETQSMDEAVKTAYYLAKNEDTVLLSPACASFDLFENYEDRGRQFKAAVKRL
ncbi:MAG: UDP-N-acetylmuramoyl-L-alanine--D-glutamate ligase [Bacteroidales bacterium]|nr:UDP-N-acetylmuramoyl-L-alanine--D-glutamate ligase [Bacteroidales bacterium]MBN2699718.1 UDP-N-acetylmuramoyl-L-alanine--D-glutamate ligase [Bacteroidales bacterium]